MAASSNFVKEQNLEKIYPHSSEVEIIVLGAVLVAPGSIHRLIALVPQTEIFFVSAHRMIYQAMINLTKENIPIDILTITNRLRAMGKLETIGGAYYITELTSSVASSANLEYHCTILLELWMRRSVLDIGQKIKQIAADPLCDILDLTSNLQLDLLRITSRISTKTEKTSTQLVEETMQDIIAAGTNKDHVTGIHFGFETIDRHFGGFQKSNLIIIAGRPGMGKTTFALHGFLNACVQFGHCGLFFSLEMSDKQLMKKILANKAGLTTSQLTKGLLSENELTALHNASKEVAIDRMLIHDSGAMTFEMMRSKIYSMKAIKGIEFVMIDYLQLLNLQTRLSIREQEISTVTRGLKLIAKDLDIPIIVLSQLNRGAESSTDKRPDLSNLRESGAIEQDADDILFLYRPEYYSIPTLENGESSMGKCEIINRKHRNGATGTLLLGFNAAKSMFYDLPKF